MVSQRWTNCGTRVCAFTLNTKYLQRQTSCPHSHIIYVYTLECIFQVRVCAFCVYDSPCNTEHHHTYDDHLECSNDGGNEDIVQFARAWNHVEHIVFFDIALRTSETGVTAGFMCTYHWGGQKERDRLIISVFLIETSVPACKDIVEEQWLLAVGVRLNMADKNHSRQGTKRVVGGVTFSGYVYMSTLSLHYGLTWRNGTLDLQK